MPIPIAAHEKHLVLVGGGHTHALVLDQMIQSPLQDVHVTVINPGATAAYSGMLPGYIAGHYERADLDLNVEALARAASARFLQDEVVHINTQTRLITLKSGNDLPFDIASIDIGITSKLSTISGFDSHAVSAKPLDQFAQKWQSFLLQVSSGDAPAQVAIIGGGVAGAELALAMSYALRYRDDAHITLIDRSSLLTEMIPRARARVLFALKKQGVELRPDTDVAQIESNSIHLSSRGLNQGVDDYVLKAGFVLSTAGARPYDWVSNIETSGQPLSMQDGFICVNPNLCSSDPRLFAVGDCAQMTHAPRPKAGVFAVRQAPFLLHNLRCALAGETESMRAYHPQKDYLKLMSLGEKRAVADKNGFQVSGKLVWRLKNHIDRKFMSQFNSR